MTKTTSPALMKSLGILLNMKLENQPITDFNAEMYKAICDAHERKCYENKHLKEIIRHCLNYMNRDSQASMSNPTYEEVIKCLM